MEAANRVCVICARKDSLYKCPYCENPYCSVACCRQHKAGSQCDAAAQASKAVAASRSGQSKKGAELTCPTEDTVPIEKLQQLGKNKDLTSLLQRNTHLRRLLTTIDDSPDPSPLLKQAMKQDADFQKFASICLRTVDSDRPEDELKPNDIVTQLLTALQATRGVYSSDETEAVAGFVSLLNECIANEDSDGGTASLFCKK